MSDGQPPGSQFKPHPVERVRGSRPDDESWRTDPLGGSRHSRWVDELRQPLDLHDRDRAEMLCAQVSRLALQDFAPAMLLLPKLERRRLQAVTAYALTLFDFARQSGLEGERLTGVNRWEYDLEVALDGQPVGQPVYVLIHALEEEREWNRDAFDLLHSAARRRCVQIRPADRSAAEREAMIMGKSLAWLLLADEPTDPIVRFAAALVRLSALLNLGDDLRRHCARLPVTEVPDSWVPADSAVPRALRQAIEEEVVRLTAPLEDQGYLSQMPENLRAAARYCQRTAQNLLGQVRSAGPDLLDTPPRVGLLNRMGLLARSRWL